MVECSVGKVRVEKLEVGEEGEMFRMFNSNSGIKNFNSKLLLALQKLN